MHEIDVEPFLTTNSVLEVNCRDNYFYSLQGNWNSK